MAASLLAQALQAAHHGKSTGRLKAKSGGAESVLLLLRGDVVGAQMGFGHQTPLQALLLAGAMDLAQADILWASDEAGRIAPAPELDLLAQVQGLSRVTEAVELEPCAVEAGPVVVPGDQAVRAASDDEAMPVGQALVEPAPASVLEMGSWAELVPEGEPTQPYPTMDPGPSPAADAGWGDLLIELAPADAVEEKGTGYFSAAENGQIIEKTSLPVPGDVAEKSSLSPFPAWGSDDPAAAPEADDPLAEALESAVDAFEAPGVGAPAHDNDGANGETLEEDDLAGDPSDPSEAARLRRQRLLRRAIENLGVFPRPGESAEPVSAPAPVSEPTAPPTSPSPERSVGTDADLAKTIEAKYAELKASSDHFATLGLRRNATRDQVKAAFLSMAKTFHPDRLPPELSELAPKMTFVFEAVREAYDALYEDGKRRAYLASLERAAPPPPPDADPEDLYRRGELLLKRREYRAAEEYFEKAHAAKAKAEYIAARGWAIYMDPDRRDEVAKAKQMMTDALKLSSSCDRAHYQLGVIARVEGDADKAERHFREAVRANPKHLEANQEIRLIEMRKNKSGKRS